MEAAIQRFACTQCGRCCNRSPEVELSEAAALADVFVFRLMFRLYALPAALGDSADAGEAYYQKKRLLGAYAARKYPRRMRGGDGKAVDYVQYLTISALTLDTSPGACSALGGTRCRIYDRRPAACRTMPLHYSRVEASAASDLKAFVETPGHGCETGDAAAIIIDSGRIVDVATQRARADALALAARDRPWRQAIVRRMNAAGAERSLLPSLREIEANAHFGATTVSMRAAWRIAAEAGLIGAGECTALVAAQRAAIDRALAAPVCGRDARETLAGMRAEYVGHGAAA
jgi:Fe-S-cluster containining protein